jgi:hypothetical protein
MANRFESRRLLSSTFRGEVDVRVRLHVGPRLDGGRSGLRTDPRHGQKIQRPKTRLGLPSFTLATVPGSIALRRDSGRVITACLAVFSVVEKIGLRPATFPAWFQDCVAAWKRSLLAPEIRNDRRSRLSITTADQATPESVRLSPVGEKLLRAFRGGFVLLPSQGGATRPLGVTYSIVSEGNSRPKRTAFGHGSNPGNTL